MLGEVNGNPKDIDLDEHAVPSSGRFFSGN